MAGMRLKFHSKGFRQLLTSPAMNAILEDEATAIGARAGGESEGYVAGVNPGRRRSRGFVVTTTTEAVTDNAKNNTLLRSIQ